MRRTQAGFPVTGGRLQRAVAGLLMQSESNKKHANKRMQ